MSGGGAALEALMARLARLPGLGPRSARRLTLHLLRERETVLRPLAQALLAAAETVTPCRQCGNLDDQDPCRICRDPEREEGMLCVVPEVGDLWALERTGLFRGRYHVLGGLLSALEGRGPEALGVDRLVARAQAPAVTEVILALPATVEGQTTAHTLADRLAGCGVTLSGLGLGIPVGGELEYLDDGTLAAALNGRRVL